jgi:hypothetical protein
MTAVVLVMLLLLVVVVVVAVVVEVHLPHINGQMVSANCFY